jgi:hypothetical protein
MNIVNEFLNRIRSFIGLKKRDKNLEYYLENIEFWGGDPDASIAYHGITKLNRNIELYYCGYILWPHRTNYCPIDKYLQMRMSYTIQVIVDRSVYEKHYPEHGYEDHK